MNSTWWANKYRPNSLSQLLGQDFPKRVIYGALKQLQKPRTWLLHGPWGAGKTSTARILAKSLVCLNPSLKGESCNECSQCLYVDQESSPNYLEVDSASFGGVDDVDKLMEEARLSPIEADHKVLVLDEAHMLSQPAQTRLLKPLEDGIGKTIIIFVTTNPDKILQTIRSRCINIALAPVDRSTVTEHLKSVCQLEGVSAEENALRLIVEHTYGHIRDALKLAQQMSMAGPILLEETRRYLQLHLDEEAAKILLLSADSWDASIQALEDLAQENSVEGIWDAMRRSINQAKLHHLAPLREKPNVFVLKLAEKFSIRLSPASEWCLGDGARLTLHTTSELLVAMALLRERLGANLTQVANNNNKRMGTPRASLTDKNFGKKDLALTLEEVKHHLNLIPVNGMDLPNGVPENGDSYPGSN
jgi:DNA polymerase III subunit gamma/tau